MHPDTDRPVTAMLLDGAPKVAIVDLGRDGALGAARRVDSWQLMWTSAGADVTIDETGQGAVAMIPRAAVQNVGDRTVVYVADANQAGRFIEREVHLGDRSGTDVAVLSGLRGRDAGRQVEAEREPAACGSRGADDERAARKIRGLATDCLCHGGPPYALDLPWTAPEAPLGEPAAIWTAVRMR